MHDFAISTLESVIIPTPDAKLPADLLVPEGATGLVIFVHGRASNRHNPRHQRVAALLHESGLGTLLFDVIAPEEEPHDRPNPVLRSNTRLFANRLRAVTRWARRYPETSGLRLGYYGASAGAAAAIIAGASETNLVDALVSRGGRMELAGNAISELRAPTLLLVGGSDEAGAAANLDAWARLRCRKSIEIIPGAGRLFTEPGALDNVATLAARWFTEHLGNQAAADLENRYLTPV